jgi:hypothetical protein
LPQLEQDPILRALVGRESTAADARKNLLSSIAVVTFGKDLWALMVLGERPDRMAVADFVSQFLIPKLYEALHAERKWAELCATDPGRNAPYPRLVDMAEESQLSRLINEAFVAATRDFNIRVQEARTFLLQGEERSGLLALVAK